MSACHTITAVRFPQCLTKKDGSGRQAVEFVDVALKRQEAHKVEEVVRVPCLDRLVVKNQRLGPAKRVARHRRINVVRAYVMSGDRAAAAPVPRKAVVNRANLVAIRDGETLVLRA